MRWNLSFCMGEEKKHMGSLAIGGVSPQTSALNSQASGFHWRLPSGKLT